MSRLVVLPVLAMVIGLSACGNSGSPTPPAAGGLPGAPAAAASGFVKLCEVLTPDRAKQLIGDDAKESQNEPDACGYDADSTGWSVTIHQELDNDGTQWELSRKVGGAADKVSGLGDDAFIHPSLQTVYARKGKLNFDVQIVNDKQTTFEDQKKLMADVLAKA